ncbi:MAG: rod shape-determining protein RodA, partial [Prevotellaceae bacterium]|nr:rod shape-determining protein RodA [Prevotellaceae bacterium]
MRDNQLNPAFRADGWVLLIFLALLTFGWFSVCGASHTFDLQSLLSFDTRAGKQ